MGDGQELSDRKKLILKAIVDAHISKGEPVGSKFLTQNQQIALSSATIRNEMAELEELGYLEQPHTSAGRIPSEHGYRFYVDSLMQSYRLTSNEINELNTMLKSKVAELDSILSRAGRLMTMLTNYPSIAAKPKPKTAVICKFKTVLLDRTVFLLVMVTSVGVVKSKYMYTTFVLTDDYMAKLEGALNAILANITIDKMTLPLIYELEQITDDNGTLINPIIKCIYETINEIDSGDIKVEGVNRLLQYPEYSDMEKLRGMLGLIESKNDLLNILSNSGDDGVNIYIGAENPVDMLHGSTLIFKKIYSDDRVVGAIGVLGPCRMDYSKVITTVRHLADNISQMTKNMGLTAAASDAANEKGDGKKHE